jgi:hypothetical protein
MQPIAFACAAETAVIASIVAADCAIRWLALWVHKLKG